MSHVHVPSEEQLDALQQEETQREEQLEDISRRLILREEELFSQDVRGQEDEDQLQRDFENLKIQIWITIHGTFTSGTSRDLEVLRSAVASIQQQEQQDLRWQGCPKDQVPVWRPQKWLSTHNQLLQKMVEARLRQAMEENFAETDQLSSAVKKKVTASVRSSPLDRSFLNNRKENNLKTSQIISQLIMKWLNLK